MNYDLNLIQGHYPGEDIKSDKSSLQLIEVNKVTELFDLLNVVPNSNPGLSISFEVASSFWKVGVSLLSERLRREPRRGVWGHAPPENFEI